MQMILEMCKDELPTDLKTIRARLHAVDTFSMSKVRMTRWNRYPGTFSSSGWPKVSLILRHLLIYHVAVG